MVEDFINLEIKEIYTALNRKKKYIESVEVTPESSERQVRWLKAEEQFLVKMYNFLAVLEQFLKTRAKAEAKVMTEIKDLPDKYRLNEEVKFLKEMLRDEMDSNLFQTELNIKLSERLINGAIK